jgi:hypothetical protein
MEMTKAAWTIPPADIARIRQHPGFAKAMRMAAQSSVDLYRNDRLLSGLLSERARALFTHVALYLHFAGEGGLTVGAMKDMCVALKLCSRGRCEAMLAVMRAGGLFKAAPNADRRRRPLIPTDELLALHRERWGPQFDALGQMIPEAKAYRAALADPGFIRTLVVEFAWRFMSGWRVIDLVPELEIFTERNAGMVILFSLALGAAGDVSFPPMGPRPLSINALATRFSVSRKHVLTMLRDAEAQGLLARGGDANDEIAFLPRGRAALEIFLANVFAYQAACASEAFRVATSAGTAMAALVA